MSPIVTALGNPAFGAVVMFVAVFVLFAVVAGGNGFLSVEGAATYTATAADYGLIAAPVALLMMAGEFDLSVGAVVALGAMTVAIASVTYGWPLWAGTLLAIVLSALVGLCNGLLVVVTRLHSFIVTLATQFILDGIVLAGTQGLTGTTTVSGAQLQSGAVHAIFGSSFRGFPSSALLWLAAVGICAWVQLRTRVGNWVLAAGGDPEAARRSGVRVGRVKIGCFIACSVCASLVGIVLAIGFGSAETVYGQNYELIAIVAAVIGGTLLTGGRGSAIGSALGALTFGLIQQGIFFAGWDTYLFDAFLGGLLLIGVLLNERVRAAVVRREVGRPVSGRRQGEGLSLLFSRGR